MAADRSAEYKHTISPRLAAALEHYATTRYNLEMPTVFVYTDPKTHHQSPWTVERTMAAAQELLDCDGLAYLKLRALQAGLKANGLGRVYERIMGEKLP